MEPESDRVVFESLRLAGWRQFAEIDLQFHPRLTVLTGANAAGKTTLLSLLASHFGWETSFVAVPAKKPKGGALSFLTGFWSRFQRNQPTDSDRMLVGEVRYSNGNTCQLEVPASLSSAAFNVQYRGREAIEGLFVPSHRSIFLYQQVSSIPTKLPSRHEMFQAYLGEVRSRYYHGGASGTTPNYRLKEALIALAVFGEGNTNVEPNPEALDLYYGFIDVLRAVLPPTLGFRSLSIRMPEVVMETTSGDFSLDSVSGGVASIIDLAFQVFMRGRDNDRFVVVIDEPENHLHPELQRTLLPGFLAAFPRAQFIVATHNPLVVGSVADSHVYALRYAATKSVDSTSPESPDRRVSSVHLDRADKAGTSNEILREVLGVSVTRAPWVEQRLDQVLRSFEGRALDESALRDLQAQLEPLGLAEVFPAEARRLLGE